MKKIAASLIVLLIATTSYGSYQFFCKKKKKKKANQSIVLKNNSNIKSVLMGRAGCFGQCPNYTIEIFETGLMRYTGKQYVPKIGIYEKNIEANKAIGFLNDFNVLKPDTLHYQYHTMVADLPGIYYFISYPDSVKKVVNADSGPIILREWALKIDSFAHIDNSWELKKETVTE